MWLGIIVSFILLELIVDTMLSIGFRSLQWTVVLYVILFFGATAGMIGLAAQAGSGRF